MMSRLVVPSELAGERADKIVAVLAGISRSQARLLAEDGVVLVADQPVRPSDRLRGGTEIEYEERDFGWDLQPEPVDLSIVHAEPDFVVIDKPSGMITHPGSQGHRGSLAAALLARFPEVHGVGEANRWGIVHRLDRDTSGLILAARTDRGYDALRSAIADRAVRRLYTALVDGTFDAPRGTIEAPIAPDPANPTRRIVLQTGKPARTHYRRVGEWPDESVTLLEVELETGRTHQIRVHLRAIEHPVIGDRWYGKPARVVSPRVFLHASRLELDHPITGEPLRFDSGLPYDLAKVVEGLTRPATT